MDLLLWIIFGGIAGWITSMIAKTNAAQGTVGDILLGIIGAVVGGFVFNFFGATGVTGFNMYSLLVAVVGALIVVSIGRLFTGGSTT
jgi:uncharacterized membrane protein YeaQ/YmgE (transglycosylase-associated protein family)